MHDKLKALIEAGGLHAENVRIVVHEAYDIDRDVKKYRVELAFEVSAK